MPLDSSTDSSKAAAKTIEAPGGRESFLTRAALSAEEKLAGDMLVFTTGIMVFVAIFWVAVYMLGQQVSVSISLTFGRSRSATIVFYLRTRKLQLFAGSSWG